MTIKAINVRNQFKGVIKEILLGKWCRKSTCRPRPASLLQ